MKKIFLNNEMVSLPNDYMTVAELLKWRDIPSQGAAVAINDKLIKKHEWNVTQLEPLCHVTVISAAFGG